MGFGECGTNVKVPILANATIGRFNKFCAPSMLLGGDVRLGVTDTGVPTMLDLSDSVCS
jgi:hypothetical protein